MARLDDMLPPGEIVRWTSSSAFRPWKPALAIAGFVATWLIVLLYAGAFPRFGGMLGIVGGVGIPALIVAVSALFSETEVAVTERHIVWLRPMDIFGRPPGDSHGAVALDAIACVELEEGSGSMIIHSEDSCSHIERIAGGRLEDLARAADRPARIWRECRSPAAIRARLWNGNIGAVGTSVAASGLLGALFFFLGDNGRDWNTGTIALFGGVLLLSLAAGWAVVLSSRIMPHLLAGCRLSCDDRRDFVGWMTDLRWRGIKPDGPDEQRRPRSRLEQWAMRLAYGEIPNIGEREPEVLVPGAFPGK